MDYQEIRELIREVSNSPLTKFELNLNGVFVKMNKNISANIETTYRPSESKSVSDKTEAFESLATIIPEDVKVVKEGNLVLSPIVGTFYESASPSNPPFVKEGTSVSKGDVLCIVEAMKVMNEITSDFDGQIAEVFVNNEDMVEFNQPLFRIIKVN